MHHSIVGLQSCLTSFRAAGFSPARELFGRWDMSMDMLVPSSPPGIRAAADSSLPAVLNTTDYWHRCGLLFSKGRARFFFYLPLNLKRSPFWSCFPLHTSPDKGLSSSSPVLLCCNYFCLLYWNSLVWACTLALVGARVWTVSTDGGLPQTPTNSRK